MPSLQEDIAEIHRKREERKEARRQVAARVTVADAATRLKLDAETLQLLCYRRKIPLASGMLEAADVERLAMELEAGHPAPAAVALSPVAPSAAPVVLQTAAPELSEAEQVQARVTEILAYATLAPRAGPGGRR